MPVTDLEQTCTDLASWPAAIGDLIAEPDRGGTAPSRSKPRSRPPWNPAVAYAWYSFHAAVRDAEQELRQHVTGRAAHECRRTGWSDGNTLKALDAIPKLAAGAGENHGHAATRILNRELTGLLLLPAIDLEDQIRNPNAPCPHCDRKMLTYREGEFRDTGKLACLGCSRGAVLYVGLVSGEPMLKWDDGEVTLAPPPEELIAVAK
jgi:hypothetical protein